MAGLSSDGVPLCMAGCGKPTYNRKPGEYCSKRCRASQVHQRPQPASNGQDVLQQDTGMQISTAQAAEQAKRIENLEAEMAQVRSELAGVKSGQSQLVSPALDEPGQRSQPNRDGRDVPQSEAVTGIMHGPESSSPDQRVCKICKKPPKPGKHLYGGYCGNTCRELDGAEHLSRMCMWCHAPQPQCNAPPGLNKHARWCERCVKEYNEWPPGEKSMKAGAGLLFSCIAKETQEHLLLFNLEASNRWCHAVGKTDEGDKDNLMVACREGAEETCYALGTSRDLKVKYYDQNKMQKLSKNLWLVDLGELDALERELPMIRHDANMAGAFGRPPTPCEKETLELRWCNAKEFLHTVEKGGDEIVVPSLGTPFRGFLSASYNQSRYSIIVQDPIFRCFCMGLFAKGSFTVVHDKLPVNEAPARTSPELTQLTAGSIVEVLEVSRELDQGRVRARIASPAGWITKCTADGHKDFITQVP